MFNRLNLRLISAIFFCSILLMPVRSLADEKPEMLFFYSDTCENCENVKRDFLPGFLREYGNYFTFLELDVYVPANLDSLFAMEERFGIPEEDKDYPAVYFMGMILEGEIPVRLRLESLVKEYLANPDSMRAVDREVKSRIPETFQTGIKEAENEVFAAYFYEQGCKECGRAEEIIEWLEDVYPFLTVDVFDIATKRNKLLAAALGVRAGMPEEKLMSSPVLFIGVNMSCRRIFPVNIS